MKKHKGLFITFEGTEGAGKSTLIQAVAKRLSDQGHRVTVTREPGGTSIAEQIRKLILEQEMDPWAELFLYEAARAEHLAHTLLPALQKGHVVLCDRFTDSTLAYQGHARGLPWKEIQSLNRIATQGIVPQMTILLDIPVAVGLERARDKNRFEAEGVAFQTRVRKGFLKSRAQEPKRWFTIDALGGTPEELAEQVAREMERRFLKKKSGNRKTGRKAKRG